MTTNETKRRLIICTIVEMLNRCGFRGTIEFDLPKSSVGYAIVDPNDYTLAIFTDIEVAWIYEACSEVKKTSHIDKDIMCAKNLMNQCKSYIPDL